MQVKFDVKPRKIIYVFFWLFKYVSPDDALHYYLIYVLSRIFDMIRE